MARLSDEFLTGIEHACDRVVAVAEALDEAGVAIRLGELESEVVEIKKVMGAMIANTIRSQPRRRPI